MKLKSILISFSLFAQLLLAQQETPEFYNIIEAGDTSKIEKTLDEWNKIKSLSADQYLGYFHYKVFLSKRELELTKEQRAALDKMVLKQGNKNASFEISGETYYDSVDVESAFQKLDEGIKMYPDRIDLHFAKIEMLGKMKYWQTFTNEIVDLIKLSAVNNNNWLVFSNTPKNGKEYLLKNMQDYQLMLFDEQKIALLENMCKIANTIVEFYPDHSQSYSNIAVTWFVQSKFADALPPLLKGEKYAPNDQVILNNIAYAYKELGEKEKAIAYYEKVMKIGDEQAKTKARHFLGKLK